MFATSRFGEKDYSTAQAAAVARSRFAVGSEAQEKAQMMAGTGYSAIAAAYHRSSVEHTVAVTADRIARSACFGSCCLGFAEFAAAVFVAVVVAAAPVGSEMDSKNSR